MTGTPSAAYGRARRLVAAALLGLWALAAAAMPAGAGEPLRGVALVIGNGAYEHIPSLPNPVIDARAVEAVLDGLGFETTLSSDRDARRLKRDLDIFLEDAEGADVAVVYYAGHGIEAGGENFLIPVDADLAALEAAGERLVPLSVILEQLQATVPVAIVLLDACRDNPFPAGAAVRLAPSSEAAPLSSAGLGETRGAARLVAPASPSPPIENLGTVIAFAAEPGRVALDGAPGANSPYAAALLRHVEAMAGEEFGTVMRMVTEEVYLKTSGEQRPWMNESLRRLLFFGRAPDTVEGPEGEIEAERRQLLLTIAALPEIGRRQVERVAAEGGVPMDAVFGMLRALGEKAPADPGELDAVLRAQSERLAGMMAERAAIVSTDGEIVRLASLAGRAIAEGALQSALALHEQAKARVDRLSATLDEVEAELRERRIEFAAVFAESAAARELVFDYAAAASDYERAFEQVERWDEALAWDYRRKSVIALYRHGEYRGDLSALEEIVARRDELLRQAERLPAPARAEALLQIGNALNVMAKQRMAVPLFEQAVAQYQEAIPLFEAAGEAAGAARARNNLASALTSLGTFDAGTERLERAISIYEALAADASFEDSAVEWMIARLNLASAVSQLGERDGDTATMRRAMEILEETVERVDAAEAPVQWASTRFNLSGAMLFVGEREGNPGMLADSALTAESVTEVWAREAFPLYWAAARNNVGNAFQVLGFMMDDETFLLRAELEYRDALEEWRLERVPGNWASATNNLANVLKRIGDRQDDFVRLEQAMAAYHACMEVWTRADMPLLWATAQNNLGDALAILGTKRRDERTLREAIAAFDAALSEWTYERVPYDWATATNNRGGALIGLGSVTRSADTIRAGIADVEAAWGFSKDLGDRGWDDYYEARLADARARLAALGG